MQIFYDMFILRNDFLRQAGNEHQDKSAQAHRLTEIFIIDIAN